MSEQEGDKDTQGLAQLTAPFRTVAGGLLPALHAVQDALGYLPEATTGVLAEQFNLSRAEVYGVMTFYHHFRRSPPGRHRVQLCRAESCQAVGGRALEAHAKRVLEIDYHQTTADGAVSLEPVYCLGNCACSPSVRVGDEVYGMMNVARLDALLARLRGDAEAAP
ncbi:thioredoxin domain-containing protein [Haliea atlantica]|nr:formate dehydrogenase subunit gamma [Haliea sp.]|tara:strand:+ start:1459 stop:1953 length:495 start_codon:yes stop_codon:yes gene_type:complete